MSDPSGTPLIGMASTVPGGASSGTVTVTCGLLVPSNGVAEQNASSEDVPVFGDILMRLRANHELPCLVVFHFFEWLFLSFFSPSLSLSRFLFVCFSRFMMVYVQRSDGFLLLPHFHYMTPLPASLCGSSCHQETLNCTEKANCPARYFFVLLQASIGLKILKAGTVINTKEGATEQDH